MSIEGGERDTVRNPSIVERAPVSVTAEGLTRLCVPTTAASAPRVRQFVRAAAIRRGAAPEWIDELVIAVNEAFSNAVRHGSGTALDDTVATVDLTDQGLIVQLVYRGDPFDVEDRELPDDVFQHSGRGRFLMRELLNGETYRFHGGMTTLRMSKHV
jgi:anti-sigma regulatory factor (Ser/Thr protein kinase)